MATSTFTERSPEGELIICLGERQQRKPALDGILIPNNLQTKL